MWKNELILAINHHAMRISKFVGGESQLGVLVALHLIYQGIQRALIKFRICALHSMQSGIIILPHIILIIKKLKAKFSGFWKRFVIKVCTTEYKS